MALRLTWTRTWPDKPEDFSCYDGDLKVGRIYSDSLPRGEGKVWRWFLNGQLPDRNIWLCSSGKADRKQEAAEALEAAYLAALERKP